MKNSMMMLLNAPDHIHGQVSPNLSGLTCVLERGGRVIKWVLQLDLNREFTLVDLQRISGCKWLPALEYVAPPELGLGVRCMEAQGQVAQQQGRGELLAVVRGQQVVQLIRFPNRRDFECAKQAQYD